MHTTVRRVVLFPVIAVVVALSVGVAAPRAAAQGRVKDIATVQGLAALPVVGYGLVVGLSKTGDKQQTLFTTQTLANLLGRMGVDVPPSEMKVENTAAVLVTADLSPAARSGTRQDVTVSSIGDAKSLQGGTLLLTPLRDGAGQVVAVAQGPLSIGGFGGGTGGSSVQVNHLTVGRVPGGAIVQVDPVTNTLAQETVVFMLREPDFATAARLADAVNAELQAPVARASDQASVLVTVPPDYHDRVPYLLARLEALPIQTDTAARVVINERTGTVVVGGHVTVGPASVAHGNLSVRITTQYEVSQPSAFSRRGDTVVVPNERVEVTEGGGRLVTLGEGTTLESVTAALNALGATPRDIIAIMQALKAVGALRAELVIL